jgi:hypothetical protein
VNGLFAFLLVLENIWWPVCWRVDRLASVALLAVGRLRFCCSCAVVCATGRFQSAWSVDLCSTERGA